MTHRLLKLAAAVAALALAAGAGTLLVSHDADSAGVPSAVALQERFVSVARSVGPSIVQIESDSGLGSGVVLDTKGHILTNAHVVGNDRTFTVTAHDGAIMNATLVGKFEPDDVAVIKVPAGRLKPARFADSSKLRVGDIVMAIGNPLGLRSSVTEGIVSALGRTVTTELGSFGGAIQTSAPINPGNSGGALVDLNGRVVGMPTAAARDPQFGASAPGLGFAVNANRARTLASQLIAHGRVTSSGRAYLGVTVAEVSANGVLVASVVANGPAAKAGIREGDLITSVAGKPTRTTTQLSEVLVNLRPGQTVAVRVQRQNGSTATVQVTLGERPGN
jgi:S1-C subfamily serine protease